MKLSIVIPCYNEARTIVRVVDAVERSPYPDKEIVLVDDASTDGTRETIRAQIEPRGWRVVYHEENRGKGAAIRSGMRAITGQMVIIQDADLEYDPNDYPKMVAPIVEDRADVVFGSRWRGKPSLARFSVHRAANEFLTALSNAFTRFELTDMECCYKAFRREVIDAIEIEENRFGFEPEIAAKVSKIDCRVHEVGVSYDRRTYAEGKKIGWRDGVSALRCIVKYNVLEGREAAVRVVIPRGAAGRAAAEESGGRGSALRRRGAGSGQEAGGP